MPRTFPTAWHLADLPSPAFDAFTVMSTFACGGGSSMGYKLAGFDVIAANDIDSEMAENYQRNLSPRHYFLMPIGDLVNKAREGSLPAELYSLDILDGSPPCSTFSMAGLREKAWGEEKYFREGQTAQVLDDLFFDYLSLVDALRPKVSIAENVEGMLRGNARGYVKDILARYKAIGYRVQLFLLNGADCQVPQRRKRVFFVALRNDIAKKHLLPALQLRPTYPWITARHAFVDLPTLTFANGETQDVARCLTNESCWRVRVAASGEQVTLSGPEVFALLEPGKSMSHALEARGYVGSHWNWVKLAANYPAPTLPARVLPMHWSEPRFITCAEVYRLSSFPDDYVATSPKIGAYMCGMSVPPFMSREVASAVRDQWLQHCTKENT